MSETEGAGYDIPDLPPPRDRVWKTRLRKGGLPTVLTLELLLLSVYLHIPFTLTYPCKVLPAHVDYVRTPLSGVVAKMAVHEGQNVEKGALLVELSNAEWQVALTRSESNVARAKAELALLQKGVRPEEQSKAAERIRGLRRQFLLAKQRTQRLRALSRQNLAPMEEVSEAERLAAGLEADLATAEAEGKLLAAGTRAEEIEKKKAELSGLEAQLQFDRDNLQLTRIYARHAGTVSTPKPEEKVGSRVAVGDLLLEVVTLEKMWVEVSVAERDFDALKVDLPLEFRVEAYPTHPFLGKLKSIGEKVEVDVAGSKVAARALVENPEGLLRPNMSGYAEIRVGEASLWEVGFRRMVRWFRVRFLV